MMTVIVPRPQASGFSYCKRRKAGDEAMIEQAI